MNNIALPYGKIIKGSIIGPIKASKDYARSKIALKKFEKQTGIIPLNKLKKKVFKSNEYFVDMTKEISNPLIKILKASSANTTDVYFDNDGNPVLSCSYRVKQNLLNKDSSIICNCINTSATANSDYYYIALCIKHNIATDQTESMLNRLTSKIR